MPTVIDIICKDCSNAEEVWFGDTEERVCPKCQSKNIEKDWSKGSYADHIMTDDTRRKSKFKVEVG